MDLGVQCPSLLGFLDIHIFYFTLKVRKLLSKRRKKRTHLFLAAFGKTRGFVIKDLIGKVLKLLLELVSGFF